ncbi:threonine-phosphate decarboxylase [Prosthecochloris sp. N3]|uniref:threonine-phosphate decarboxylase n=1 Tax=Prosthecochloris ethylica TaxID=2743976 RepID=A0ABR9XUJ6_9CHLB|nr:MULTISPECIES: threonine-phosphate decarboxylase CobD [Prosthecochloris]MBF0587123.1 threonine-phosphate decarboxylase [Prosthecochloris ethylica]MBF0637649.1 threonine-phosphate decarboxylase [Prosthecochloris ethylica]NUK48065.1 threonine-phosphate decarboxylase [Prosthecochloris ethylica]RNA64851.1 threonine-phosphate decarboxylase [Prosthecochloris sp. ZM_2]
MTRDHLFHHEHGGEPDRRYCVGNRPVIDFSVNISPLSPQLPETPLDSFALHRYPAIDGSGLREFYTRRFDLDPDTVLPLNGAVEGIYLIPRALGFKRVMVFAPSFFDYERASRLAGARVTYFRLEEQNQFALPGIEQIAEKMRDVDALFAANPNNPTGTRFPKETLLALASRFPDKWFVIDEAFIQFVDDFPGASLMKDVRAFKNVIVLNSLTKFYALPGLRLGGAMAHPDTIRLLLRFKEPWTVNAIAEAVAAELVHAGDFEQEVRRLITSERAKIFKQVQKMPDIDIRGYAANFFLAHWNSGSSLDELLDYLIEKNMYVRDCRNFPGLEDNYFRFSIRKPEENDLLLEQFQLVGSEAETASA